jgi:hypothetical protein
MAKLVWGIVSLTLGLESQMVLSIFLVFGFEVFRKKQRNLVIGRGGGILLGHLDQ